MHTSYLTKGVIVGLSLTALFVVSACGDTPGRRAATGAGIGAGTGALGAAVLGADPVTGALVGGAVGGVTGAATNRRQIDLGN